MALTRYGELRNQLLRQSFPSVFAPAVLRDADSNYVPIPISERLVQAIWYDQRIQTDSLRTLDGRRVRVIFPGWWNLEAGPDFRNATLQFDDGTELKGDVEIHLRAEDWNHHGHHHDPLYNDVLLHVVLWEAGSDAVVRNRAGDTLPILVLQHQLTGTLESLYDDLDLDAYPHNVTGHGGRCFHTLNQIPAESMMTLLEAAGDERFQAKVRRYDRWIHRIGAPQAFYEGWMEALGYKANKAAFRCLAQRLPASELAGHDRDLPALLFGLADFLPVSSTRDAYTKRLWSAWWKLRSEFGDRALPADTWRLHGIRPANHPHRRVGAAAALLKKRRNLADEVVGAIASDGDPGKLFTKLRDAYWSRHFTLGGKTQSKEIELIGAARVEEIVTNVVLPFVAAAAGDDESLRVKAKARYDALSAAPGNTLVRLASLQLFGTDSGYRRHIKSTRQQQGLMQVFQDFCINDKSACAQCQFPELARQWSGIKKAVE